MQLLLFCLYREDISDRERDRRRSHDYSLIRRREAVARDGATHVAGYHSSTERDREENDYQK